MQQYLDAIRSVLSTGERSSNRTGIDTLFKLGLSMKFDLSDGFPLVTTKALNWRSCFAEMLGFLRGYDNAESFRYLGTNVWNANANENKTWLANPNRVGTDDLGRIYGVQARDWRHYSDAIDQLRNVYNDLKDNIDNRRELVTHWNPGELSEMALPPCHVFYQFGLHTNNTLDLFVYIRSNDMGLGMPFNIAGYAWLLSMMAHITNHKAGTLHYYAFNYHIYLNHIEALLEQLQRSPKTLPYLEINSDIRSLSDLEITPLFVEQISSVCDYNPHSAIPMKMSI